MSVSILQHLENDMKIYRENLERVNCRLSQELISLDDIQSEVNKLENRRNEVLEEINQIKKEIEEEEKRIRCPKCNRVFTLSYIKKSLNKDEYGLFWKCPSKECDFKGYKDEKGFTIKFEELLFRKKNSERDFAEKNFQRLDMWITVAS